MTSDIRVVVRHRRRIQIRRHLHSARTPRGAPGIQTTQHRVGGASAGVVDAADITTSKWLHVGCGL